MRKTFKNFKNKGKSINGFTLIELMVVLAIIAILTAIFLASLRVGSEPSKIRLVSHNIVSDIRLTQSNTLGAVKYEDQVPEGGWGVHMEEGNSQYAIFADINANHSYNATDEKFVIKDFSKDIQITSIDQGDSVDIVFDPPDPTTYINSTSTGSVLISLTDDQDNSESIRVNFFGLIEVVKK